MNQPDRNNKTAVVRRISNNIPLSILVSLFIFVTLIRKIHSMGWIVLLFIVPFILFLLWRMWKLGTRGELLSADAYVWLSNAVIFGCGIYYWDFLKIINH